LEVPAENYVRKTEGGIVAVTSVKGQQPATQNCLSTLVDGECQRQYYFS